MFKRHERDLELLDLIAVEPVKLISENMNKTEDDIYKHLKRIRARITEYQQYLNTIYAKQRRSKRVRKMTIDGSLDEDEQLTI